MSKKYTEAFEKKIRGIFSTEKNPDRDTQKALVAKLASESDFSEKELAAKLRHMYIAAVKAGDEPGFIYHKAPEYKRKTGEPVQKKAEIVAEIEKLIGVELESLDKATRADLVSIRNFLAVKDTKTGS